MVFVTDLLPVCIKPIQPKNYSIHVARQAEPCMGRRLQHNFNYMLYVHPRLLIHRPDLCLHPPALSPRHRRPLKYACSQSSSIFTYLSPASLAGLMHDIIVAAVTRSHGPTELHRMFTSTCNTHPIRRCPAHLDPLVRVSHALSCCGVLLSSFFPTFSFFHISSTTVCFFSSSFLCGFESYNRARQCPRCLANLLVLTF